MPKGVLKRALAPEASLQAGEPAEPARVLTVQPVMEEVTVGDTVLLGEADIVAEGLTEALLPALAVPEGVGVGEALGHTSARMTLPLKSATYTVPEGEEVTP